MTITVDKDTLDRLLRILGDVAAATELELDAKEIDRDRLRDYIATARTYAAALRESAHG